MCWLFLAIIETFSTASKLIKRVLASCRACLSTWAGMESNGGAKGPKTLNCILISAGKSDTCANTRCVWFQQCRKSAQSWWWAWHLIPTSTRIPQQKRKRQVRTLILVKCTPTKIDQTKMMVSRGWNGIALLAGNGVDMNRRRKVLDVPPHNVKTWMSQRKFGCVFQWYLSGHMTW